MEEQLVGFEVAKLAKEKGFNISEKYLINVFDIEDKSPAVLKSIDYYSNQDICILRTTQSLLQKWLRDVHNIHLEPKKNVDGYSCLVYPNYELYGEFWGNYIMEMTDPETRKKHIHKTYEEALEVGLLEGLKLIEL